MFNIDYMSFPRNVSIYSEELCVSRRDVCFFSGRTAERREIGDALRRSAGSGGKGRDNVATDED